MVHNKTNFINSVKKLTNSFRAKQKEEERSAPAGRLHSHLVNEQDTTGPGQSPAQDVFFLTFGETGRAPDKCICPLGKIY